MLPPHREWKLLACILSCVFRFFAEWCHWIEIYFHSKESTSAIFIFISRFGTKLVLLDQFIARRKLFMFLVAAGVVRFVIYLFIWPIASQMSTRMIFNLFARPRTRPLIFRLDNSTKITLASTRRNRIGIGSELNCRQRLWFCLILIEWTHFHLINLVHRSVVWCTEPIIIPTRTRRVYAHRTHNDLYFIYFNRESNN